MGEGSVLSALQGGYHESIRLLLCFCALNSRLIPHHGCGLFEAHSSHGHRAAPTGAEPSGAEPRGIGDTRRQHSNVECKASVSSGAVATLTIGYRHRPISHIRNEKAAPWAS